MDVTAILAADLALLTAALDDPSGDGRTDVANTVQVLAADARLAVRSFVGLTVTVTIAGPTRDAADRVALRFTLLDDHVDPRDIETSLRLPQLIDGADRPGIQTVLYATTPGAFVDMAADIAFLTGREFTTVDLDQHRGLAGESDITGLLQDRTAVDEAIGVLIGRGRTREQASAELDTLADTAHTDRATEGARILTALTRNGPDGGLAAAPGADLA